MATRKAKARAAPLYDSPAPPVSKRPKSASSPENSSSISSTAAAATRSYLPIELQEMVFRYCRACYTDQELWFGIGRVNRYLRQLVERDVVEGRPAMPENDCLRICDFVGIQKVCFANREKGRGQGGKRPFQTSAELQVSYRVGFRERVPATVTPDGSIRYDSDRLIQDPASSGPYLWYGSDLHADSHDGRPKINGINREFQYDRLDTREMQKQAEADHGHTDLIGRWGDEGYYRAIFRSVGDRLYFRDYHDNPGTIQMDFKYPLRPQLISRRKNLLNLFDPDGSRFGSAPSTRRPTFKFAVCALDRDTAMQRGQAAGDSFATVTVLDCDIDTQMAGEAVLTLTVDWREMWTKKLAREREVEWMQKEFESGWRRYTAAGNVPDPKTRVVDVPGKARDGSPIVMEFEYDPFGTEPYRDRRLDAWFETEDGNRERWAANRVHRRLDRKSRICISCGRHRCDKLDKLDVVQ